MAKNDKNNYLTVRMSEPQKEKLKALAYSLDMIYSGNGSISKMLKAIANNELTVIKNLSSK